MGPKHRRSFYGSVKSEEHVPTLGHELVQGLLGRQGLTFREESGQAVSNGTLPLQVDQRHHLRPCALLIVTAQKKKVQINENRQGTSRLLGTADLGHVAVMFPKKPEPMQKMSCCLMPWLPDRMKNTQAFW